MRAVRHSYRENSLRPPLGRIGAVRTAIRKPSILRTAVTAAATGIVVVLPVGAQAMARLSPSVIHKLALDPVTLSKVREYDRYRTQEAAQRRRARTALAFARRQIGKPYRWGAAGPAGFDCSGLAMAAWRRAGVVLPRVTYSQYSAVKRKVGLKDLRPGDLIFFRGRAHVGMYVGNGRFLHAPNSGSRIRIDRLGPARLRQFAGAVRPGAPVRRRWSPSIRQLVAKIDRMSADADPAAQRPPDTGPKPPAGIPAEPLGTLPAPSAGVLAPATATTTTTQDAQAAPDGQASYHLQAAPDDQSHPAQTESAEPAAQAQPGDQVQPAAAQDTQQGAHPDVQQDAHEDTHSVAQPVEQPVAQPAEHADDRPEPRPQVEPVVQPLVATPEDPV
ncbi:C40 family peptidase [Actinomadura fibrosa]|uniref:NlpC/P60 family protein n=1 Tax=Actinomadura fibrosa TaxID=111802 RepID=A0ABW2XA60_9ACTN|nr:C40 family peptidase [Actinomadura fibrosa]